MRASAEDLSHGKWGSLLQRAGIDSKFLSGRHGPCPLCGGKDRFRFHDKEGMGNYFCNVCGPGNGFKLLMSHLSLDFAAACDWVRTILTGEQATTVVKSFDCAQPGHLSEEEIARRKKRYKSTWDESKIVVSGDPVWNYLKRRCPSLTHVPPTIRFHPNLPYFVEEKGVWRELGKYSAMIAAVQGGDDVVCNLHRTYLTEDGFKADVPEVKKALPSIGVKGGAIRLGEVNDVLGVTEGIETAFCASSIMSIPTWSTISAAGMASFVIPDSFQRVKTVMIFADHDMLKTRLRNGQPEQYRPGLEAAQKLSERLRSQGLQVLILQPGTEGADWADEYQSIYAV